MNGKRKKNQPDPDDQNNKEAATTQVSAGAGGK